jgi:hypothetical protein
MNDEIKRWTILTLDLISATVTVSDTELKKNKTYHIPFLTHAIIKGECLLISTSFNKIMEINLSSGSRRFI